MSKEESGEDAAVSDAPSKDPNADIYENRGPKKIVRVVTVIAYLFCVSFVGILLSAYYLFLWEPPHPRLIERERLRADPQVQFLFAVPPSVRPEPRKKEGLLLANGPNRAYGSLPGPQDDVPDGIDRARSSHSGWLNAMLLKLRRSLVQTLRAQTRNSSDTFVRAGKALVDSTGKVDDRAENATSRYESRGGVTEEKAQGETTIVEREDENRDREEWLDDVAGRIPSDSTRRFGNATTGDGDRRRAFEDDDSSSTENRGRIPDARIDTLDERKILAKGNETRRRTFENDDPADRSYAIAASERHVDVRTSRFLPTDIGVNGRPERNHRFGGDGRSTNSQTERIAERVKVSTDSPREEESGYTDVTGGSRHRSPPDDSIVKQSYAASRNPKETQIEKMTARSTTIGNKRLDEPDLSATTQRQKSLWEILTEAESVEEETSSVELTSTSTTTAQDYYRNNFTSTTNDGDESVIT